MMQSVVCLKHGKLGSLFSGSESAAHFCASNNLFLLEQKRAKVKVIKRSPTEEVHNSNKSPPQTSKVNTSARTLLLQIKHTDNAVGAALV